MPGIPRRQPWPFDCVMVRGSTRTGLMLNGYPKPTVVSAQQVGGFSGFGPDASGYEGGDPLTSAVALYDDLSLGLGQRMQIGSRDRRYRFADQADLSIGGQTILGPKINSVTPGTVDSTNGISHFFEIGGALYALNGRYALKRANDTATGWNTPSKDFGAGKAALSMAVFNSPGSSNYVYVAMGDSELFYRFDGTTWTQHGTLYALDFVLAGHDFYRANGTNLLAKVNLSADPWTAGNWSAANSNRIGDVGSAITRLVVNAAGILLVFKTDGVYVLDEDGNDLQLYSDLRINPIASNGKYHWKYENFVHITMSGRHFRISPDLSIEPIGPERVADNSAPVKGYVTAGVATPFASYAGLYNPDSGHSYLMKFGAYQPGSPIEPDPNRIEAWHGSLSGVAYASAGTDTFSSRTITAMHRTSIGAPSNHERLYIGCSDGTIHYFILPCVPNPLGCTSYEYGVSKSGRVFYPYWHGGFSKTEKVLRAASAMGTVLGANSYAEALLVRTAGDDSASFSTYPSSGNLADAIPGERSQVEKTATLADIALKITNGAGAAVTATPVVTSLALDYKINPPDNVVYEVQILAMDGLVRQDGVPLRLGAKQIKSEIKAALRTTAGVTLNFRDDESLTCQFRDYQEVTVWDDATKQHKTVIIVKAVESDTVQGTTTVTLT